MRTLLQAVLLSVIALAGCGGGLTVIRQASPNPMIGARLFGLAPVSFEGLQVDGQIESAWLARMTPVQSASFATDKAAFAARLAAAVAAGSPGYQFAPTGPFILRPRFVSFDPGRTFPASSAVGTLILEIVAADGNVVDQVQLQASTSGGVQSGGSGGRLRSLGDDLGGQIARYVATRSSPPR